MFKTRRIPYVKIFIQLRHDIFTQILLKGDSFTYNTFIANGLSEIVKSIFSINSVSGHIIYFCLSFGKGHSIFFIYLRWLKTVSSTYICMGCYNHSLSLNATIMVSKNCPIIGKNVGTIFMTQYVTIATV